jgi:hypothetical protein
MCDTPQDCVSGDLNLLTLIANVQYRVKDPYNYHYRTTNPAEIVSDVVQSHIRSFVSARGLEQLLNVHCVNGEIDRTQVMFTVGDVTFRIADCVMASGVVSTAEFMLGGLSSIILITLFF